MEKLEQIIINLQECISKTELKVSDKEILKSSIKIYLTELINNSKEAKSPYQPLVPKSPYHEEPLTDKQRNLIKQLNKGVVPAGINKREGIKLIQELNRKT